MKNVKRFLQSRLLLFKRKIEYAQKKNKDIMESLSDCSFLFITHDNGGGTQVYENTFLHAKDNYAILRRLKYQYMDDNYFSLEIKSHSKQECFLLKIDEIARVFECSFDEIIVNSLTTYQNYDKILRLLISFKKRTNKTIRYFVHDYNSVCPNSNLFANDDYCNLNCNKNKCNLIVGHNTNVNILEWRENWNNFFANVDEIRCFSESSLSIMLKAYPQIKTNKCSIIPHEIKHIFKAIENSESLPLCIGFVGVVSSEIKGKNVVKNVIKKFGDNIPIRIIGASFWKFLLIKKKVKYLGKYKHDKLRDILIKEKVSLIVFPSKVPETFSYTISELIECNLPIVCFDYGAQAEKIKKYSKGKVCKNIDEMLTYIQNYNI